MRLTLVLIALPLACSSCDARREDTNVCTARVQAKAYELAVAAATCKAGDACEVVRWDALIGRRGCAPAFASYALFPSTTDRDKLAASARKLAAEFEACGACGVAGIIPVDAAACDVDAGRCVPVFPGAAAADAR